MPSLAANTKPSSWAWTPGLLEPGVQSILRDCSHLCALWAGTGSAYDLIARRFIPAHTNTTRSAGTRGKASTTTSTIGRPHFELQLYQPVTTSDGNMGGDFTLFCFDDAVAEARAAYTISQRHGATDFDECIL